MKDEHPAPDTSVRDIVIVVSVIVILYIGNNITPVTFESVTSGEAPAALLSFFGAKVPVEVIKGFFLSLQNTLAVISVVFLAGIFWVRLRGSEVHHHEHEKYAAIKVAEVVEKGNVIQWQVILEHVNSDNPAEWKIAILEADDILDEVLEDMGYVGDTVAEKLKGMSRTKVSSYDAIWEAHKVRNEIAHGGAIDMEITKKMAKDTIAKFENAFKDLGYL